jgi:hypothetical protein
MLVELDGFAGWGFKKFIFVERTTTLPRQKINLKFKDFYPPSFRKNGKMKALSTYKKSAIFLYKSIYFVI